jgi:predicted nucleic acid-binding protein
MIAVDTYVIAYLFLTSEHSPQAEQALRRDPEWTAPLLWRSEFRNVLTHYVQREVLSLHEAQTIMDAATDLMRGREVEVVSHRVLSLAAASTCSAYDCEFVALAQDMGLPLVTADGQILEQFPEVAVALDDLTGALLHRSRSRGV